MSISSLLDISRRALNVQTQSIRTIGDNIANVNTPGYSRRRADQVSTTTSGEGAARTGTGVKIDTIVRIVDKFLNSELEDRISDRSFAEIRHEFLSRAEAPFILDGEPGSIGYQLTEFYSALEDLTTNPSNIPLRAQVMEKGGELVQAIRTAYDQLALLQREADGRIAVRIEELNELTTSIASLNYQITKSESSGNQEALSLRDQRDQLLRDLSELVNFQTVENNDGSVLVYLNNGFALVNGGNNRKLEFTLTPSWAVGWNYPPGLDGAGLGHIVHSFEGGEHLDLTSVFRATSGEISGLLSVRGVQPPGAVGVPTDVFDTDGELTELAARIEYVTRALLVEANYEYQGGANWATQPGVDLDGNPTGPFELFSFIGANAGNNFGDFDGDGLTEADDLNSLIEHGGFSNFSSILKFNVTDERRFAAARDQDPTAAISYAAGDDSNVQALLTLKDRKFNFVGLGGVSTSGTTLDEMYNITVSRVGSSSKTAKDDHDIFIARETQIKELQSSVSGVSLDEEFAKLINYQRAFEAAARMVRIADDMFGQIIQIS